MLGAPLAKKAGILGWWRTYNPTYGRATYHLRTRWAAEWHVGAVEGGNGQLRVTFVRARR